MSTVASAEALPKVHAGKVRELYDAGAGRLLMVATDRVSAFDVIMAEPIPEKGRVLTAMSCYWCDEMADVIPGSLLAVDPREIEAQIGVSMPAAWAGRAVLVRRAEMLKLECIVRGYLAGQAWEEYEKSGTVHGMEMPAGLRMADKLEKPIFTPSTKAESGHDLNIGMAEAVDLVGAESALAAQAVSLELYRRAAARAAAAGFVLADTKFELGYVDGVLCLCDEVCTPDSSRLWPADQVVPGTTPPAFDKQPLPRLAGRPALGPHPAPTAAAGRGGRGHVVPLHRRLRACHRTGPDRLVRCLTMRFRARVDVELRAGIADPEGATIERALPALGFEGVAHVRAGRSFSFEVDANDESAARTTARELADRLLANPVIEQSHLELEAI